MIQLDTQSAVRLVLDPSRLSRAAAAAIQRENAARGLAIAGRTLWEVAMLDSLGRIELDVPVLPFLQNLESRFVVLPMTAAIADRAVRFTEPYPADPSDRVIGATALVHGLRLVTSDKWIRRSGQVPCIW